MLRPDGMSLKQRIGHVLMPRIYAGLVPDAGVFRDRLAFLVEELSIRLFVPYRAGVLDTSQMCNVIQDMATEPVLFAADVEFGPGQSFLGATSLPAARAIAETRAIENARLAGEITARECRAMGIHCVFGPVVDVNNNSANPIIGTRSYGETIEPVVAMANAYIDGVHAAGGLATAKHFPGHGDTRIDSHYALPTIHKSVEELHALELAPFVRAFAAGVDCVMTAHIAFPALDPSGLPATLSRPIVTGLLREELGFDGVVLTDALTMRGIVDRMPAPAAATEALIAGCDIALFPGDEAAACQAVERALEDGRLTEARLNEAVSRVLRLKEKARLLDETAVDLSTLPGQVRRNDAQIQAIAAASIRVQVRADILPISADERTVAVWMPPGTPMPDSIPALQELMGLGWRGRFCFAWEEAGDQWPEAVRAAVQDADTVLLFAAPDTQRHEAKDRFVVDLNRVIGELEGTGRTVVYVSLGDPYCVACANRLDAFGMEAVSQRAVAQTLMKPPI